MKQAPRRATRPGRRGAAIATATATALAAVVAAGLASSCASPLKIDALVDPLAILEPGALAYARISGAAARELAPALLGASQAAQAKPLLERTRLVALGLGSALPRGDASMPELEPQAPRTNSFQAVLVGDYPFRAAALSLGSNPDWKREKPAYRNAKLGLYAALPGPQLVLASDRPIEPLLAAAKRPGVSPIPERLAEPSSRELVLWAPRPFSGLASLMIGEAMDIPVRGLLIAASPAAGERDRYEATVIFIMEDAKSLRTYRGILKLAWYGMASAFFAEDADAALALPVRSDGELFVISKLSLSRGTLVKFLASLRSLPLREGRD
jgi:hypothetical protein